MSQLYNDRGNLAIGFHAYSEEIREKGYSQTRVFDSVRGCFWEGNKIEKMEMYEKTHIQIAIRNKNCIKGIFFPREEIVFPNH